MRLEERCSGQAFGADDRLGKMVVTWAVVVTTKAVGPSVFVIFGTESASPLQWTNDS